MTVCQLAWRDDLIVSRQGSAAAESFVIKDPDTGRFFRLREMEHYISRQLNGQTSLEEIRRRVEVRYGGALSPEALSRFVERLEGLGLLRSVGAAGTTGNFRRGRVTGHLFYLRFRAFDPDALFGWLAGRMSWLMTPAFVACSAAMIGLALVVTILNWTEILRSFAGLLRWGSLLQMWGVMLLIIGAHEFAHGLTCKRFGGRVHELGFMLLYFQPAFYCNVSDAWLFPEKSRRLWVTFAGAYFEMFLWAFATLLWRVTDPTTTLNHVALIVTATSGIKTVFNLNPLIKLDGYYLLSDWLEMPNLRQRAFAHLRARFGSLLRPRTEGTSLPRRDRWIYTAYGLVAGIYTWGLLGWLASHVADRLVARLEGWGLSIFVMLVAVLFHRSVGRVFSMAKLALVRPSARVRALRRLAVGLLVCGLSGWILHVWHLELKVAGEFRVRPVHNADVRVAVEGIIEQVFHEEGDRVRAGDLIAQLCDQDLRVELGKLDADIREKRARLAMLRAGPREEEILLARTVVTKAEHRLKYARQQLERDSTLFEDALVSTQAFELTEETVTVRSQELEEAQNRLKVLQAGPRPEAIDALEAELSRDLAQQGYVKDQLERLAVASPASGVITTRKLREKQGQFVERGDLIAEVHQLDKVLVEISVLEKDIADVQPGQAVVLKARAYPSISFRGTVESIAPIASLPDELDRSRSLLVLTRLDNPEQLLKSDMTGRAKIYCGQRSALVLLGRRLVRYLRVEFWSWW